MSKSDASNRAVEGGTTESPLPTPSDLKAIIEAERSGLAFVHWRNRDTGQRLLMLGSGRERLTVGRRPDSAWRSRTTRRSRGRTRSWRSWAASGPWSTTACRATARSSTAAGSSGATSSTIATASASGRPTSSSASHPIPSTASRPRRRRPMRWRPRSRRPSARSSSRCAGRSTTRPPPPRRRTARSPTRCSSASVVKNTH